jgi:hypothetical protein
MPVYDPPTVAAHLPTEVSLQDHVPGTHYTYEELLPDPHRFEDGILAALSLGALLTHLTPRQRLIVERLYLAPTSPDPGDLEAIDQVEREIARAYDLAMKTVRRDHQEALSRLRAVWSL